MFQNRIKSKRKLIVILTTLFALVWAICFLNFLYKIYTLNYNREISWFKKGFSIKTFNVNESDIAEFTNDIKQRLLALVTEEKPDILCFQELSF